MNLPMSATAQTPGNLVNHLQAYILENDELRIIVLPEAGGRIWQITHKPSSINLLWNNPALAPEALAHGTSYDDNWSGGWDELFPNDEAAQYAALSLPDHGELWTARWNNLYRNDDQGAQQLTISCNTPVSRFHFEKRIRLRDHNSHFSVDYKLTNCGHEKFPFLFKLHPALCIEEGDRIDLPSAQVKLEPEFPGTLKGSGFEWPYLVQCGETVDMRIVPATGSAAVHFFYATGLGEGWCGITRRKQKLSIGLKFDPSVFSSCWLFATYGGWNDHNVAVLEPATGYPFRLQSMIENGRARWLEPGESLSTEVVFSVQPGLGSIGGVASDGTIVPALR
jgi:galactose mutarotase-like enzyme